jgi:hypothetical protein
MPGQRGNAPLHENSQLAGRFRRWWQVLGSNQRRLSRRFYRPLPSCSKSCRDLYLWPGWLLLGRLLSHKCPTGAGSALLLALPGVRRSWIPASSPCGATARYRGPSLDGMSAEDAAIKRDLEKLRRDGSVVARFGSAEEAAAWRATMRRTCRAEGLRIRTGLANADDRIAWAYHVDHVVTEAAERAARRAMEAAYTDDEPGVPFHELVLQRQFVIMGAFRLVGGSGRLGPRLGDCGATVTSAAGWRDRRGAGIAL